MTAFWGAYRDAWDPLQLNVSGNLSPDVGYSINFPADWSVIVEGGGTALRAMRSATVVRADDEQIGLRPGGADFELSHRSPSELSLEDTAALEMQRAVPQGQSERFGDRVGGLAALGFLWIDGVRSVGSWFAEPVRGFCVSVHCRTGRDGKESGRDIGLRLLTSLAWRLDSAFA